MSKMKLSIIIPAYNEENVIENTIVHTVDFFSKHIFDYEIVVVDDGSKDKTVEKVNRLCNRYGHVHLLKNGLNRGKGYAVRSGMLYGTGDYLLFMDADLSTPVQEFNKFISEIKSGTPVIIGTRKKKGAHIVKHQPPLREIMGKFFTAISNLLLGCRISDYTCGFKVFSNKAKEDIFPKQRIERWGYDSEILFLARRNNCPIKEIPVVWHNDTNTKVRLVRDAVRSFIDLIRIRLNDITKRY